MSVEAAGVISRLMEEFGKLPGIGPKTAERLTHYLLAADRTEALQLAEALRGIAERVKDGIHLRYLKLNHVVEYRRRRHTVNRLV